MENTQVPNPDIYSVIGANRLGLEFLTNLRGCIDAIFVRVFYNTVDRSPMRHRAYCTVYNNPIAVFNEANAVLEDAGTCHIESPRTFPPSEPAKILAMGKGIPAKTRNRVPWSEKLINVLVSGGSGFRTLSRLRLPGPDRLTEQTKALP